MSYTGKAIDLSKFDKQKEVELASERVDLSIVDDVKARSKAMQKDMSNLMSLENDFFSIKRNIKNLIGLIEDTAKVQSKDVSKAIKALKELGLDDKEFFNYDKQIQEVSQEIKSIKSKI